MKYKIVKTGITPNESYEIWRVHLGGVYSVSLNEFYRTHAKAFDRVEELKAAHVSKFRRIINNILS